MNKEYGITEEQLTSDIPVSVTLTGEAKTSADTGSFAKRDLSGITLEKLRQIDEDELNFDGAKFSIGIVFSRKFKAYMEEKNKQQPDQSILDSLKNELTKLHHEERSLYNKSREEIKEIRCYYSKILRDKA